MDSVYVVLSFSSFNTYYLAMLCILDIKPHICLLIVLGTVLPANVLWVLMSASCCRICLFPLTGCGYWRGGFFSLSPSFRTTFTVPYCMSSIFILNILLNLLNVNFNVQCSIQIRLDAVWRKDLIDCLFTFPG